MVPQPCIALLMLFPESKATEEASAKRALILTSLLVSW